MTDEQPTKMIVEGKKRQGAIPGLDWVSVAAVLFGLITISPALIYMSLAIGPLGGVERFVPVFVTILLFTEVGRIVKRYVTSQEAYIIYFMLQVFALWLVGGGMFGSLIVQYYYRQAPYTTLFGLAAKFPTWYAPPLNSWGPLNRTFLSADWLWPVFIGAASLIATTLIDYGVSFVTTMVFIDQENLPFPVAPIDVQAVSALTERTPEKITYFSFAAMFGLTYEFLIYGFPSITQVFLGTSIALIPYPFVDLTSTIEGVLPGAVFGIATDLANYMVGWLIPFNSVFWVFAGSMGFWVLGNHLALLIPNSYFATWQSEWAPGSPMSWWYQRANFDLWISPSVGISVGVAAFVLLKTIKPAFRAFKSLTRLTAEQLRTTYVPMRWILAMVAAGCLMGFGLSTYLVPDLWYIWLFLWIVMPWIQGFLAGRATAETGLTVQVPYVRETLMLPSTAPGNPVPWVVPYYSTSTAGIITHRIKVAKMLNARPLDYYKAYVILIPVAVLVSFIFWSIFWLMAPMPSSFYPWTAIYWPVSSLTTSLFISRAFAIFKPDVIVGTAAVTWLIVQGVDLLKISFFSPIGFLAGVTSLPPYSLAYMIGALAGKYLEGKMGKDKWEARRSVMIAGVMCGEALAIATAIAITIIGKVVTTKPF